jgi:hypothetical protein
MVRRHWWWRFVFRKAHAGFMAKVIGPDNEIRYVSRPAPDGTRAIVARDVAEVFPTRRAADDAVNSMLEAWDRRGYHFRVDAID